MEPKYDTILMTTPADYLRVRANIQRQLRNLPSERMIFVGSSKVGELIGEDSLDERCIFVDEESLIKFSDIESIIKRRLNVDTVPRGIVGWYYQQFLKMKYSTVCENDYYLIWDGDTVPCKTFSMFDATKEYPYLDLKHEYNEEYFVTMSKLIPGMGKVIGKSFISEHMLMNKNVMTELIATIESNDNIFGASFYEKILEAIPAEKIRGASFSEYETYGTYVALRHQDMYRLRDWHSFRFGSIFWIADEMTDEDYEWLSKDFDAISFEKSEKYLPDYAALFQNPEYRQKLSARQIVEAIQDLAFEGNKEVWEK